MKHEHEHDVKHGLDDLTLMLLVVFLIYFFTWTPINNDWAPINNDDEKQISKQKV